MAIPDIAFGLNILYGIILIAFGLAMAIGTYPLVKGMVKMNHDYGVRFPQSYYSDESWLKINAYGGKLLMVWGVLIVIAGACLLLIPIQNDAIGLIVFLGLLATMVVPIVLTYRYARNFKQDKTANQ